MNFEKKEIERFSTRIYVRKAVESFFPSRKLQKSGWKFFLSRKLRKSGWKFLLEQEITEKRVKIFSEQEITEKRLKVFFPSRKLRKSGWKFFFRAGNYGKAGFSKINRNPREISRNRCTGKTNVMPVYIVLTFFCWRGQRVQLSCDLWYFHSLLLLSFVLQLFVPLWFRSRWFFLLFVFVSSITAGLNLVKKRLTVIDSDC